MCQIAIKVHRHADIVWLDSQFPNVYKRPEDLCDFPFYLYPYESTWSPDLDTGYTPLDFDTDGAKIRAFFAKKECPDGCGRMITSGSACACGEKGCDCPECGGDMSAGCEHKCKVICFLCGVNVVPPEHMNIPGHPKICEECEQKKPCPDCGGDMHKCVHIEMGDMVMGNPGDHKREKKVPFEKVGSDHVFWNDDGISIEDKPSRTSILTGHKGKITKDMIRQAFEYYATKKDVEELFFKFFPMQKIRNEDYLRELILNSLTPEEIEALYMKHGVSDEPVECEECKHFESSDYRLKTRIKTSPSSIDIMLCVGNDEIGVADKEVPWLIDYLNRFIKNGVKK